jgi:hypothetical protein
MFLTGLVILPACKRTPEHARVDAALAPLMPGDTVAVGCLRLDKLKTTPFYAKYVNGKQFPALDEFTKATGIDVKENLWELYFTTNGTTNYVFIRGKFGGDFGVEPDIKASGVRKSSYKGRYLFSMDDHGVLLMNTGAAVAGKVDDLKALVDGLDNPARKPPQALLDMVNTLPGTAQFWAVSSQVASLIPAGRSTQEGREGDAMQNNLLHAAHKISSLKLWGDLSKGLELHVRAVALTEADAAALRDVFKAGVGLARLSTKEDQTDMLKLYDGMTGSSDGPIVRIDVNEPFELVDPLLAKVHGAHDTGTH